jgi:hypothetical protein
LIEIVGRDRLTELCAVIRKILLCNAATNSYLMSQPSAQQERADEELPCHWC